MRAACCGAPQRHCRIVSPPHTQAARASSDAQRRRACTCRAAAESSSDDVQKSMDMLNKMMEATEKTDSLTGTVSDLVHLQENCVAFAAALR